MKIIFLVTLFILVFSAMTQDTSGISAQSSKKSPPASQPIDNTMEEQQAVEEEDSDEQNLEAGPYDRKGNYIYYNRLMEEKKAAKEGKTLE